MKRAFSKFIILSLGGVSCRSPGLTARTGNLIICAEIASLAWPPPVPAVPWTAVLGQAGAGRQGDRPTVTSPELCRSRILRDCLLHLLTFAGL
jgi:hypothetical protein